VEQELLTLPEYLSSPPVFSGVRVTPSFVLYVCFVDHCLSFCPLAAVFSVLTEYVIIVAINKTCHGSGCAAVVII
jgi:hypothetical protein